MASEKKNIPIAFVVDASMLKRIDDWRRQQDDLPSRSEAIRRLIDQSLEAA